MADQDLLNVFDDCIERLASGQSLDECLRRYPQHATALRPMLEAGVLVQRSNFSSLEVTEAQRRVRLRVAQAVQRPRRPRPSFRITRLVASIAAVFLLMLGVTGMLAENSLPGDTLYGLKLFSENARTALINDGGALQQQFNQRRVDEIEQLLALHRRANVTFQGEVQAISDTEWLVTGLRVEMPSGTQGVDSVQIGDLVEIQGSTTSEGRLVATAVQRIGRIAPLPSPTPTNTPTATNTSTQTSTITPTSTMTFTSTPTATATFTPTVIGSAIPTVIPSATVCAPTLPEGWHSYTVQSGDSLSSIAVRAGTTVEALMRINCLTDARLIFTGQTLYLPSSIATTQSPVELRPTASPDDNRGQDDSNRGDNSGPGGSGDDGSSDNSGSSDGGDDNGGRGSDDSGHGGGDD